MATDITSIGKKAPQILATGFYNEKRNTFGYGIAITGFTPSEELEAAIGKKGSPTYADALGWLISQQVVTKDELELLSEMTPSEQQKYILTLYFLTRTGVAKEKARAVAYAAAKSGSITIEKIKGSFTPSGATTTLKTGADVDNLSSGYDSFQATPTNTNQFYTAIKDVPYDNLPNPIKEFIRNALKTKINAAADPAALQALYTQFQPFIDTDTVENGAKAAYDAKLKELTPPPPLPTLAETPAVAKEYDALTKFFLGLKDEASDGFKSTLRTALASGGTLDAAERAALKTKLISASVGLTGPQADALLDKLADGKITLAELGDLRKAGINISNRLFTLIANKMNANETSNQEIDLAELLEAVEVIQAYADAIPGMTFDKAAEAYINAESFRNVSLSVLREGGATITGYLNGVNLGDPNAVRTALQGKVHDKLIDALIAYLTAEGDRATAQDAAGFLLRCAMASLTGMWGADKPFGVEEIEGMQAYNPKKVTKENLLGWLESGEVEEEEEEGEESGSTGKISEAKLRKMDLARTRIEKARNGEEAEAAYNREKGLLGEDPQALQLVANAYIKDGNFKKAIEFAKRLPPEIEIAIYRQIIEENRKTFVEKLNASKLDEAAKILKEIRDLIKEMRSTGGDQMAVVYSLTYQLAQKYAEQSKRDSAPEASRSAAYQLINDIPAGTMITIATTESDGSTSQKSFSVNEALIRIAYQAGDKDKLTKLKDTPSLSSFEKAMANYFLAQITPDSNYEERFGYLEAAYTLLASDADPSSAQIRKEALDQMKQMVEISGTLYRLSHTSTDSHNPNKVTDSKIEDLRKKLYTRYEKLIKNPVYGSTTATPLGSSSSITITFTNAQKTEGKDDKGNTYEKMTVSGNEVWVQTKRTGGTSKIVNGKTVTTGGSKKYRHADGNWKSEKPA